jgi:hypothetical protein
MTGNGLDAVATFMACVIDSCISTSGFPVTNRK